MMYTQNQQSNLCKSTKNEKVTFIIKSNNKSTSENVDDGKNVAIQENQQQSRSEFSHQQYKNSHSRIKTLISKLCHVIKATLNFIVKQAVYIPFNVFSAWIYDKMKDKKAKK